MKPRNLKVRDLGVEPGSLIPNLSLLSCFVDSGSEWPRLPRHLHENLNIISVEIILRKSKIHWLLFEKIFETV